VHIVWPWLNVAVAAVGSVTTMVYVLSEATWAAWAVLISVYFLLLGLDSALTCGLSLPWRWAVRGLLALAGGFVPVAIVQIESHFADEEFFVVSQALALSLLWLLLLGAQTILHRSKRSSAQSGVRLDRRWLSVFLLLLVLAGLGGTVRAYQRSFYPSDVPSYPRVSPETPFVCGEVERSPETFDGTEIFRRLLAQVEANPLKGPPEYGMLALGTRERRWASVFRETLLDEATRGLYTSPAHSVKSVQGEAALRAYYFPRVQAAFPGLFSGKDVAMLEDWFAAINRRALTVEWVDWMYALAFTKWPEGPYENQENGAGLLALLEAEELAPPDLSSANRDYLESNRRGWVARFRNTDDALVYQPEWINNAYFQSLYTGEVSRDNMHLSFEWLLAQALPDGSPLRYNHPGELSLAGVAYLGAEMLEDPRHLWLAEQALTDVEKDGEYLFAQPGVEGPVHLSGHSPSIGSCLLYGGSGLPNQIGPLAPDKLVFRDGWSESSPYLLLNLRFTGWHRYKASNTITLLYQNTPLVADVLVGESADWLPEGRSLFRDKRIPRENLNGLLVERTGMSAILHALTGIGSQWAQDPPRYAQVVAFETGDELDWSHTRLVDWRGWQHDRRITFWHNRGPIVVMDEAAGPARRQAALMWRLSDGETIGDRRVHLETGEGPVEVLFVPTSSGGRLDIARDDREDSPLHVLYRAPTGGELTMATVFLPSSWVGAEAALDREGDVLRLTSGQEMIAMSLDAGDRWDERQQRDNQ
jgi:hypothetical protein